MRRYYGYIRVSTMRQGEHGVSLQEQRDAITRYAERNGLAVSAWFEERETAAKRGRPVFGQMLQKLRRGEGNGVIIHKIDRSARNLRDWADLGELLDQGIEVHFANESLDLKSRGGRLSADIQAVVAADYIRNLREEARKGIQGRLKQGLYPFPAPTGYLDCGQGKAKAIDPVSGPLVRQIFELYASKRYNLRRLEDEADHLGLRNRNGSKLGRTALSVLLNNPFYMGLIHIKRTGETFRGAHEPLISTALFQRVQAILRGKTNTQAILHDFLFRRLLQCRRCGYSLIGERQKGHIYYRCQTRDCPTKTLREEVVEEAAYECLKPLEMIPEEKEYIETAVSRLSQNSEQERKKSTDTVLLQLGQIDTRLNRLTDAYVDALIERDLFERRKAVLLVERRQLEERLAANREDDPNIPDWLAEFLERTEHAYVQYREGLPSEKRELLEIVTSNRQVEAGKVYFTRSQPFELIANRFNSSNGGAERDIRRIWDTLLPTLIQLAKDHPKAFRVRREQNCSAEA